jgi:hypothetical protein
MTRRDLSMLFRLVARATLGLILSTPAFAQTEAIVYTLYRTSPHFADMRLHVATFDANESESYNRENCLIAAGLFGSQPGITARYFCEKGRYRS